jgi:hypothetical protein
MIRCLVHGLNAEMTKHHQAIRYQHHLHINTSCYATRTSCFQAMAASLTHSTLHMHRNWPHHCHQHPLCHLHSMPDLTWHA